LDRRLRVGETEVYAEQIGVVLKQSRAADQAFQFEVVDRHIVVEIEMTESLFSDIMRPIEELQRKIESEFLTRLGIEAEVRFVAPQRVKG
jgi:phenylacetate-coenzyme A ligase PaaK-like adenylate-forming protein